MPPDPELPVSRPLATGSPEEEHRAQRLGGVLIGSVQNHTTLPASRQALHCCKGWPYRHTQVKKQAKYTVSEETDESQEKLNQIKVRNLAILHFLTVY